MPSPKNSKTRLSFEKSGEVYKFNEPTRVEKSDEGILTNLWCLPVELDDGRFKANTQSWRKPILIFLAS